ncbi:MAG TPA: radical SAM protein [Dehalococcoidia bacterium]|nr:radical SAM protein [Dehalococcoidia bacterium]
MTYRAVGEARQRLSREQGTVIKDWGGKVAVALVYPNTYYIGMSNLGLHAVYGLLNSYTGVVCERVFWEEDEVRSLESQRPLSDFTVLAFSVNYELDYFNIVRVLKASGIPLRAADRDERYPLVIGGGPCIMANPAPLSPFFDCLCVGEAEAILPAMVPVLAEGAGGRRDDMLEALASLPGVYVPLLPSESPIARQWTGNLDDFPVGSVVLTHDTELGELFLIEVERGCQRGCRFCLVSTIFQPMRFRSRESLLAQARRGLSYRRRIGLVGPVVSDHPQIEELLVSLRQMGAGLSISSMRINPLSPAVLTELAKGGTRTVTLAPEAGSERLRRVINKGVNEDDILRSVVEVAKRGFRELKLYFMIGLPSEIDEDILEIVTLALKCKDILDEHRGGCRLSLNVAPFVPKAGTPCQWLPMAPVPTLNQRLSLLKKSLPPKGIRVKHESPGWSQVQAVLARGDAGVAEVLVATESVSLSGWRQAVKKCRLNVDYYAHQQWDTGLRLPWSMIDSGTGPEKLKIELDRAIA